MKFDCKQISINNEELGCTVSFYDRKQAGEAQADMTIDEIIESIGDYVMLQRTYPEDDFETDYYYIETSNPNIAGELKNFIIKLSRTKMSMTFSNKEIEISINPIDKKFNELKEALRIIANNQGELIIEEWKNSSC